MNARTYCGVRPCRCVSVGRGDVAVILMSSAFVRCACVWTGMLLAYPSVLIHQCFPYVYSRSALAFPAVSMQYCYHSSQQAYRATKLSHCHESKDIMMYDICTASYTAMLLYPEVKDNKQTNIIACLVHYMQFGGKGACHRFSKRGCC